MQIWHHKHYWKSPWKTTWPSIGTVYGYRKGRDEKQWFHLLEKINKLFLLGPIPKYTDVMKTKNIFDFRKREAHDVTAKSTSKDAFNDSWIMRLYAHKAVHKFF